MVERVWRIAGGRVFAPSLARLIALLGAGWCLAALAIIASGREAEVRPYLLGGLGLILGGVADLLPPERRRRAATLRLLAAASLALFLVLALPVWLG